MSWLPQSRTARRRLAVIAAAAPVMALAVGLALYGMRGSISYFYTPAQALAAHVEAGRPIQLGGLVQKGSVVKRADGAVAFVITDNAARSAVVFKGDLPDLFREGQGVVATGAYDAKGGFVATQILAKHDERYMPRELTKALKAQGEWRGAGGGRAAYDAKGAPP